MYTDFRRIWRIEWLKNRCLPEGDLETSMYRNMYTRTAVCFISCNYINVTTSDVLGASNTMFQSVPKKTKNTYKYMSVSAEVQTRFVTITKARVTLLDGCGLARRYSGSEFCVNLPPISWLCYLVYRRCERAGCQFAAAFSIAFVSLRRSVCPRNRTKKLLRARSTLNRFNLHRDYVVSAQ